MRCSRIASRPLRSRASPKRPGSPNTFVTALGALRLSGDATTTISPTTAAAMTTPSPGQGCRREATKNAAEHGLPVHVVVHRGSLRDVYFSWVAAWDDNDGTFLDLFSPEDPRSLAERPEPDAERWIVFQEAQRGREKSAAEIGERPHGAVVGEEPESGRGRRRMPSGGFRGRHQRPGRHPARRACAAAAIAVATISSA